MSGEWNCIECHKLTRSHRICAGVYVCHTCYVKDPNKYDVMRANQSALDAKAALIFAKILAAQRAKRQVSIPLIDNVTLVDKFIDKREE
jgi:hypothetical protein